MKNRIEIYLRMAEFAINEIRTCAFENKGDDSFTCLVYSCMRLVYRVRGVLLEYFELWPSDFFGNVLIRCQSLLPNLEDALMSWKKANAEFLSRFPKDSDLPF